MRTTLKSRIPKTAASDAAARDELQLLVAWTNPYAVFAHNLGDFFFGRGAPGLVTSSQPDRGFWRDVDVCTPFPRRGLIDSAFAHAALLGLLYAVSIWPQFSAHLADPLSRQALSGYTLSGYLPELHGAPSHLRTRGKHDPALAKQEILSLPETPDNFRQTIVAPPKIKLRQDVELPNLVAAVPVQPLAASERDPVSLRLPRFVPQVIGPAVDSNSLHSRSKLPTFVPQLVEPSPEVAQANSHRALPALQPKVVEPAPDLGYLRRAAAAILAHLAPPVAEPLPAAPDVADAHHTSAQIIALNLHPAEVHAPVQLPSGNRSAAFAASPNGRAGATGAPGPSPAAGAGAGESKSLPNAPAGINVSAPPAPGGPVHAPHAPNAPNTAAPAGSDLRARLAAAAHPPAMSIPTHPPIARESELENRIFAGRRSYTLSVNMPNLNAATGSWIIHFAERIPPNPGRNGEHNAEREPGDLESQPAPDHAPIAAPEVVSKSDPAYPGDLMQDGVQGTVVLTAVIRADGSVGEIAVVKSLDPRLDRNASEALSHWLFRPALKAGRAIDLEAVITVPFRAKGTGFR